MEVKPLARSRTDHYQRLFTCFESILDGSNAVFSVVDEIAIDQQPKLHNYEKLYQYRKRPTLDMARLHNCSNFKKGKIKLARLVADLGGQVSLREIYSWIALGYLMFNIDSESLTMATEVEFHVS